MVPNVIVRITTIIYSYTGPGYLAGNLMDQVKDVEYGAVGQVTAMKYLQGEATDYKPKSGSWVEDWEVEVLETKEDERPQGEERDSP